MAIIDINELDNVFRIIREVNKKEPKKWRDQIVSQLTSNDGINEFRDLAKLKALVQNFVEEQELTCSESIYQTDRVAEHALEFIENLVKIVGYKNESN